MRFESEVNIFNPSALNRKFSAIQTNFDVTLGKISAIISDSDIEEYQDGHTTMHTRMSSAIQDLDGFHQTVSDMRTEYDGEFERVDGELSTFDQTLQEITLGVSSVKRDAIKTDTIYYLATDKGSGVTRSTSGWTTTPQSMTSTNKYLWIYHKYVKMDGTTTDYTDPVIAGVWGNTGASTPLYWLSIAESSITKKKDGSLTPTSISINAKTRSGSGSEEDYNGRFKIGVRYTGQSLYSIVYDSEYDESSHTYTLPNQSFDSVRVWLFKSGTTTNPIDIQTINVVEEGSDAYTVVLSNESHTFAGGTSSAISGSAECSIIAMKGANRVAATIGTITGQPSGMTTSISGNGTQNAKFTVSVTTAMNTRSGVLTIPVTVDGKAFNMSFTYSLALKGDPGNHGVNTATVYMYRLLTTSNTPMRPENPTTYTFSTKTLSGDPGKSWSTTIPSGDGTLWVAVATASSNTDTDTIEASEWTIAKLARDGVGLDGYNKATITLYRRVASTPSKPSGSTTYTFSTGTLSTLPLGWSTSIPAVDANHNPCYATSVSVVSREDTYTIASSAWTSPVKIVEDGENGVGVVSVESLRYVSNSTTPPAKPTSEVTETGTVRGRWTKALPALTDTYKYIYTCDQVLYDDTSIGNNGFVWTDVVLNNALTDLVTRVAAAELKIQDDEIVATVRKSESYKNDLASKNATYSGTGIPTNSNLPASGWATDDEKAKHLNDTFMSNSGKIYQYVQGSYGLRITFSNDSRTEATRYDYVRIYYQKDGKTYALPDIGGTDIANASVFVPTNAFWLYWKTDGSQHYYGFRIVDVEWVFNSHPAVTESSLPSITVTDKSGTDYPETTHPYTGNEEKMWKYTTTYTANPTLTYGWVEREDPSVRTLDERMAQAELKITNDAIISTVTGSDFGNLVTSAIEQTATGIHLKAKYVSWNSTYSSMTQDGKLTLINEAKVAKCELGNAPNFNYYLVEGQLVNTPSAGLCISNTSNTSNRCSITSFKSMRHYKYTGSSSEETLLSGHNTQEDYYYYDSAKYTTHHKRYGQVFSYILRNFNNSAELDVTSSEEVRVSASVNKKQGLLFGTEGIGSGNLTTMGSFTSGERINGIPVDIGTFASWGFIMNSINLRVHAGSTLIMNSSGMTINGKTVAYASSSSERYKHSVNILSDESLNPHKLYDLKPKQYTFNDTVVCQYDDMKGKTLPGFIAEDVAEIYPSAAIRNKDGQVENWDERRIIPGMLALIQEQNERIKRLERMMN